ncbi:MAG: helical backbone metal receptor [Anaerolineales bacterium]|nr:helical backbone metal receptor [Anaerolineales bacterium]
MTAIGNFDELGLSGPPLRVVSLVPSITESLFDLGCGDRVRGVTDYCIFPADKVRDLPKVGGTKNPDIKRIKAILPDLIIASQEENRREVIEALQGEGFRVWLTFPKTVADTFELLWAIIRLFDVPKMGQVVDAMERVYEYAMLAAENAPRPRVFVPIWREPKAPEKPRWWMTINRETYMHDLLRVCGGANVFADRERRYPLAADLGEAPGEPLNVNVERDTRYPRVTPAEVAEHAPEVILLPTEPYAFSEADLAAFADYPEMPAVKYGRIHVVDGSLLTWPGTRVGRALAELPAYFNFVPTKS